MKFKISNNMLKDVIGVASGSVLAQGFSIAIMPIISRIYSPFDMGVTSMFVSTMSLLFPFSSLMYYTAIILPKSPKHANAIAVLSFTLQIAYFGVLMLCFLCIGDTLCYAMGWDQLKSYDIMIPFAVLAYSVYELLVQYAIRLRLFEVIAKTKISQSFSGGFLKIILGLFGLKPLGLIIGTIIGYGGGLTFLITSLRKQNMIHLCGLQNIKRVAIKYRNFPIYSTPTAFINALGGQIVPIMIFSFYGATVAGFFSIAQQLLVIPSVFVGTAIGQVFLQRASVAKYNGNLNTLTTYTYKRVLLVGVVPIIILALSAPFAFDLILGSQWKEAGYYARYLALQCILAFAFSPISHVFNIQNKQRLFFILEVCYFGVQALCFLIGTIWDDPYYSILLYSIGSSVMICIRTFWALKIAS